jgi:nicotinamidase-related amidase
MDIEKRTAENTAVILVDYVSGFASMIGSQSLAQNVGGGRALIQTARTFGVPLVVTMGPVEDPRGVLYPELQSVLGDHPIVHRGLAFDAFEDAGFCTAVAETERHHLVIAGLMTDGCVMHTTVGALRRGYDVSIVVDATASESTVAHDAALSRLSRLGADLRSWLSLASEFQGSYANVSTVERYREIQANMPGYAMLNATIRRKPPR